MCIIRADESRKNIAARKTDGTEDALGIPSGVVFNRDVVNTFREVLVKNGETERGASVWSSPHPIQAATAKELFEAFNSDAQTKTIFDRVFPVVQALSIKHSIDQYNGFLPGEAVLAYYDRDNVKLLPNKLAECLKELRMARQFLLN